MSGKQTRSTGGNRRSAHDDVAVSRRRYVAAGGALLAGLAGCLGDDDESDESPGEASVTVVEEFIDALDRAIGGCARFSPTISIAHRLMQLLSGLRIFTSGSHCSVTTSVSASP